MFNITNDEITSRAAKALDAVGMYEYLQWWSETRVAIAGALAEACKVLLLDELAVVLSMKMIREPNDDIPFTFLQCTFARQTWAMSDLPWTVISNWTGDTLKWICHASEQLTTEDFEKFLVICWTIWRGRNRLGMENMTTTPHETVAIASSFLSAFREANATQLRQQKQNRLGASKWSLPPVGTIKINFDGAVLQKGCEAGIGGVARDSNGSILAWFSYKLQRRVDGEIAKALAATEAADLARKFKWNNVWIEGDCLNPLIN
ncbi:UNVERIFIED_CONTAM: ABC transporter I family member 10 [Sesamum radiatum]|uniref:ABC transporter I family member 10 n=1 Tax=Sesamum radiatum TaxID=300843 RepID=A0AAW2VL60_SESRA